MSDEIKAMFEEIIAANNLEGVDGMSPVAVWRMFHAICQTWEMLYMPEVADDMTLRFPWLRDFVDDPVCWSMAYLRAWEELGAIPLGDSMLDFVEQGAQAVIDWMRDHEVGVLRIPVNVVPSGWQTVVWRLEDTPEEAAGQSCFPA